MLPRERRHDHVRQPETELRGETLLRWRIRRVRARIRAHQIAMYAAVSQAGIVCVWIHSDADEISVVTPKAASVLSFVWPGTGGT